MAAFENKRLEALAQALAKGLPVHAATRKAGYSRQCEVSRRRAARAEVVTRVGEIELERIAAAADLVPLIRQLTTLAAAAGKLGSAAGMVAARGLLAEAALHKRHLAASRPAATSVSGPVPPPVLTKEEWIAAFAPKAS
ncbi:MAG TPA: hypothetical protein VII63_00715 [Caulobacteraceae bacterium]